MHAMNERAQRGGKVEHKVRQIARRVMSHKARNPARVSAQTTGPSRAGAEPGWKQPDMESPRFADGPVRPQQPREAT
jgi:hypothetical protein